MSKENGHLDYLLKEKKKIKVSYSSKAIIFCGLLFAINILLSFEIGIQFNYAVTFVLLAVLSIVIPSSILIFLLISIHKEKFLKAVDILDDSYFYIINMLIVLLMYLYYYHRKTVIEDLGSLIALFSVAWSIFGIAIAIVGIWMSINSNLLLSNKKDDDLTSNYKKRYTFIGFIFVSLSLGINLILLLSAVSYFSTGNALEYYSFFVATLFVSTHTMIDILAFLFIPVVSDMFDSVKESSKSIIEVYNDIINLEKTNKHLDIINQELKKLLNHLDEATKELSETISNKEE